MVRLRCVIKNAHAMNHSTCVTITVIEGRTDMCIIIADESHPHKTVIFCRVGDDGIVTMLYVNNWSLSRAEAGGEESPIMALPVIAVEIRQVGEIDRPNASKFLSSNSSACTFACMGCDHYQCDSAWEPARVVQLENYSVTICESQQQLLATCKGLASTSSLEASFGDAFNPNCYPTLELGQKIFFIVCRPKRSARKIMGGIVLKYLPQHKTRMPTLFFPTMHNTTPGTYSYQVALYVPEGYLPKSARYHGPRSSGKLGHTIAKSVKVVRQKNVFTKREVYIVLKRTPGTDVRGRNTRQVTCQFDSSIAWEAVDHLLTCQTYSDGKWKTDNPSIMIPMSVVATADRRGKAAIKNVDIGVEFAVVAGNKMVLKLRNCPVNFNVSITPVAVC
jgi:hypothetical protein